MKNREGKPAAVTRLIRETARDNPDAIRRHREMSRRGGKAAAESNRLNRAQEQQDKALQATALAEDAKRVAIETAKTLYSVSEEGDILPPDPGRE